MTETPSFRSELHRLERDLYQHNRKLIDASVEGTTDAFHRYERRYQRAVPKYKQPSSMEALAAASRDARAIVVGDYHSLSQAQRAFFRLLRAQKKNDPKVIIALEMFPSGHDDDLAKYQAGKIKEATLLERLNQAERWPFGGLASIQPVLDLARERSWRVIGIDAPGGGSLDERDEHAATVLAEALDQDPKARAFVLIGEMHVAHPHLPKAIDRRLGIKRKADSRVLRVHQNADRIWFELRGHGKADEHDVVALEDGAFALLTASPVVCQQSFLTWLDQMEGGAAENVGAIDVDTGRRVFERATLTLGRALDLPARAALESVEVVGPADLSFFARLQRSGAFSKQEMGQIRAHILASESYYVPRSRLVYLATLSVNHAAEEAAHMLRHTCSHEGIDDPKGLVDAFYSRALNEAIGFMGSKLVNPKRKCPHLSDLEALVAADTESTPPTPSHKKRRRRPAPRRASTAGHKPAGVQDIDVLTARFVLAHKQMERGEHVPWLSEVFQGEAALFNAVTHVLGYILGDHLYYALVRGQLGADKARDLFFEPFEDEGAALMLYFELAARVGVLTVPRR